MNDRFKFRAWDECNNKMHYDFQFIKSGDSGNDWMIFQSDKQELNFDKEKNFCINICPNPYFAQQLKIMQSTGLKDKNGKLIYEGDIVNQIYEDETTYKCEVVYKNCSFQLKHIEDKNKNYINTPMYCYAINYLGHYTEKRLEVIGNIYENEDLLNENS